MDKDLALIMRALDELFGSVPRTTNNDALREELRRRADQLDRK